MNNTVPFWARNLGNVRRVQRTRAYDSCGSRECVDRTHDLAIKNISETKKSIFIQEGATVPRRDVTVGHAR